MDVDGLTAAEQLEIANNTVYGRKGMLDFSPVPKMFQGAHKLLLQPASRQALLETNTTNLSSNLRMPAVRSGMLP